MGGRGLVVWLVCTCVFGGVLILSGIFSVVSGGGDNIGLVC